MNLSPLQNLRTAALAASTLALGACGSGPGGGDVSDLRPGMSREEVEAILGKPQEVTGLSITEKTQRLEKVTNLKLDGVHALNQQRGDLTTADPALPPPGATTTGEARVHYFYHKDGKALEVIFLDNRLATYGTPEKK